MDVERSSDQLNIKTHDLSRDLNTLSVKVLGSACLVLQDLLPGSSLGESLRILSSEDLGPKPKRRNTRASRSKKVSLATSSRTRKRGLTDSSMDTNPPTRVCSRLCFVCVHAKVKQLCDFNCKSDCLVNYRAS